MTLKYCQSHRCHTYATKDRNRGRKDNRTNQTRRRSSFYYGNGNFCSLNCYNDWADDFMNRAIDSISGRLNEPKILTEDNAWVKDTDYNVTTHEFDIYYFRNKITNERRPLTAQQYNNPSLVRP